MKQSAKNANRVIENKKEIVEFYADWVIQGISFTLTIATLYFVYVLFEQESKEKEAQAKNITKQKINRIKGKLDGLVTGRPLVRTQVWKCTQEVNILIKF